MSGPDPQAAECNHAGLPLSVGDVNCHHEKQSSAGPSGV